MASKPRNCVIAVLSICALATGCSSIPTNTGVLLDRTAERIETRSEVVTRVLRAALDEAMFSRQDVEATRKSLEGITGVNLSPVDKKTLEEAVKTLRSVETNLGKLKSMERVSDDSRRVFSEAVTSIRFVRQVVGTETDKKAVIQDMIDLFDKTKEKKE